MAKLRLQILVPNLSQQRFDCHSCTNCCRDIAVHLTASDRRKIDEQGWRDKLEVAPYMRLGHKWVLNQTADNRCVFLLDNGHCRIHAELGASAKPIGCQLFPFVLLPVADAWQLSYRFDCPSVAGSKGSPIGTHLASLKKLAAALPHPGRTGFVVEFQQGRPANEKEVQCIVDALDRRLKNPKHTLRRRISELAHITRTLRDLKVDDLHDQQFTELIELVFAALDSEVSDVIPDHPPPTPRHLKILRQQIFTHCEAISVTEALGGWRVKTVRMLSQFARSRRFCVLAGQAPPSIVTAKKIPFAAIEAVAPAKKQAVQVDELVTRYLRAQVLSRSFYGPHFYGWDMVMGLEALLSRLAVWGWLARYCAAAEGRGEVERDDAIRAIGIIARAAGISKALGSRTERLRLSYLQPDHGIERLLQTFPLVT